jgi:hypothetical protein
MLPAVDAVTGSHVYAQFDYAIANGFDITEVASFNLSQSGADSGFCQNITQFVEPFCKRFPSILMPIADELDHRVIVA